MASQITSLTIVYSTVYSDADQRKHQSSAALAFVWGIHRSLVNSPHKGPVTRKRFPFDDVIMVPDITMHTCSSACVECAGLHKIKKSRMWLWVSHWKHVGKQLVLQCQSCRGKYQNLYIHYYRNTFLHNTYMYIQRIVQWMIIRWCIQSWLCQYGDRLYLDTGMYSYTDISGHKII